MKNYIYSLILIFTLCLAVNAQSFDRLEKLVDTLEDKTEVLVGKISKDIDRSSDDLSNLDIEKAFLAEQILASTKLMKRLVDKKHSLSTLRHANKLLFELVPKMPRFGSYMDDWNSVKNSIDSLNSELERVDADGTASPVVENNMPSGKVFWTGEVDATVHLIVKGSEIKTRTIAGKTYPDGIPSFTAPLPDFGNYSISVNKKDGRGKVKIIQQPNAANDYTAIVEIHDKGGGARSYTIEISW